ncbi:Origin recognition complex, subunit 1 [Malassezia yamatoensis]|uniref:Origin recognition complex subunit 1 n=1 Tax=Malassezia yamatoensis TaxID=253288 RepID=A0AAJ5YXL3_9BASI|nr:Origin recognition complex, subunit 1 [Malassezia yamatoensis]
MQREELEASLAHVRAAERSLRVALGEEEESNEELPRDLPAAYTKLLIEYRRVCAQYDKERKIWLNFKNWWSSQVRERRRKKRKAPSDIPVIPPQFSPRALSSEPKVQCEAQQTPPNVNSSQLTPRRSRDRILQHRMQVRAMLQENPNLFKRSGRYAQTDMHVKSEDKSMKRPKRDSNETHAAQCLCCEDYYAAIGGSKQSQFTESKQLRETRDKTSRHRHDPAHQPTPPDYWHLGFPSSGSSLNTNCSARPEHKLCLGMQAQRRTSQRVASQRASSSKEPCEKSEETRPGVRKVRSSRRKNDDQLEQIGSGTPRPRRSKPQRISSDSDTSTDSKGGKSDSAFSSLSNPPVSKNSRSSKPDQQNTPRKRLKVPTEQQPSASLEGHARNSASQLARSLPPMDLPFQSNPLHSISASSLNKLSAHERARRLLHVGATPEALPCRHQQFETIVDSTMDAIRAGTGGCLYVYGVPGTGKTATVREAIRTLKRKVDAHELPTFQFVEINGMKLASANQAYTELWSAVYGGKRLHPRAALSRLTNHFSSDDAQSEKKPIVVLMDELDLFVTSRQDVIYNLFHWPNLSNSHLVVIAVANTMDLPERTLQPKIASRLGMTRIPFTPYTDRQLLDIVRARLHINEQGERTGDAPATQGCERVFKIDALLFAAKRVANVSGDARRMLDVCRRVVELAEYEAAFNKKQPEPISILQMRDVLNRMARSGRTAHIAALSLHAKLLLTSMYACVRKTELTEVEWGEVISHHAALCRTHSVGSRSFSRESEFDSLNEEEILRPLATLCALGIVVAVGAGAGSSRAGPHARYMVMIPEEEAKPAMQDSRIPGL